MWKNLECTGKPKLKKDILASSRPTHCGHLVAGFRGCGPGREVGTGLVELGRGVIPGLWTARARKQGEWREGGTLGIPLVVQWLGLLLPHCRGLGVRSLVQKLRWITHAVAQPQ